MNRLDRSKKILILILLVAAFLRLWNLGGADVITDEGLNGFRSIGYIDFFLSEFQPTPYDWLGTGDLPAWTKLSFHDHPPLTFIIQHIFFKLGGVNNWSLRLPFALAGIGSVLLMYFIGKELFSSFYKIKNTKQHEKEQETIRKNEFGLIVGLVSAAILAINNYHVWVSRIGLQESIVIFLNLLAVYFFIKGVAPPSPLNKRGEIGEQGKYLILTGVAFGLAMLAKYTSIILLPIFIIYLLIYRRDLLKSKYLYWGGLIALVLFSPVIIYNLKLYQLRGHYDFQLSYLLGQNVPDWQFRLGRLQAGGFMDRLSDLLPSIARGITPVFSVLVLLAVLFIVYKLIKGSKGKLGEYKGLVLIVIIIFFHLLLFLAIGPRERFVAMIIPYLSLIVAFFILKLFQPVYPRFKKRWLHRYIATLLIAGFVGYEIFFAVNTALKPNTLQGKEGISYSKLKFESLNWGYNELDQYLESAVYQDSYPAFQFPTRFQFLEDIKQQALDKAKTEGKAPRKVLLIYDQNMHSSATVWYIFRPFVYQGWPFVSAEAYLNVLATEGDDFFRDQGVEEFVFIKATDNTLLREAGGQELSEAANTLEEQLDVDYVPITNSRVGEAFRVYWFE